MAISLLVKFHDERDKNIDASARGTNLYCLLNNLNDRTLNEAEL